jgi:hypothetical protein
VLPVFPSRVPRESVERQLAPVFAECDDLWYVRSRPWDSDPHGYVKAALERHYRRVQLLEYNGVEVFRYSSGNIHQP